MISKNELGQPETPDWRNDPELFNEIVQQGFERAVRRAIAHHHLDGRSVPLWQDGRIVELHPDGSITPLHREEDV